MWNYSSQHATNILTAALKKRGLSNSFVIENRSNVASCRPCEVKTFLSYISQLKHQEKFIADMLSLLLESPQAPEDDSQQR